MNFNLKYALFHNWTFFRWVKLILSLFFIGQAVFHSDIILGIGGLVLLFQTLLNTCVACNNGACEIPEKRTG